MPTDSTAAWDVRAGAVVERPRDVAAHPLLERIYRRHDARIADALPDGDVLEVAFGRHLHPEADLGLEGWAPNAAAADAPAVVGDARALPFERDAFDAVVGRRFLHHVPASDRPGMVRELARIVRPGGRVVLLEGTPGWYRRLTKGAAFRLGLLAEDTDRYGHLSKAEVVGLVDPAMEVVQVESLGSPLAVACISESPLSRYLFPLYRRTQVVDWWTLLVAEHPG